MASGMLAVQDSGRWVQSGDSGAGDAAEDKGKGSLAKQRQQQPWSRNKIMRLLPQNKTYINLASDFGQKSNDNVPWHEPREPTSSGNEVAA
jgi:hypothetical protein